MITAIETLHKTGYTHNDLKPDNIMLDIQNTQIHAVLIDFGFTDKYMNGSKHIKKTTV